LTSPATCFTFELAHTETGATKDQRSKGKKNKERRSSLAQFASDELRRSAMMDTKADASRNLPNQVGLSRTVLNTTRLSARIALALSVLLLLVLAVHVEPASAQDPSCKPVVDAAVLQARTPSHVYATMTGSSGNMTSETITTSDAEYMKTTPPGGSWRKSNYSPKNQAEQATQASHGYTSCQHAGDESVNGEAAAIYTEINKESGVSGKLWVSKKRGLPLKGELALPTSHFSMRYEYDNVRPPTAGQ
jgi:hypothetical protein